jgi:hypothetical protein
MKKTWQVYVTVIYLDHIYFYLTLTFATELCCFPVIDALHLLKDVDVSE